MFCLLPVSSALLQQALIQLGRHHLVRTGDRTMKYLRSNLRSRSPHSRKTQQRPPSPPVAKEERPSAEMLLSLPRFITGEVFYGAPAPFRVKKHEPDD